MKDKVIAAVIMAVTVLSVFINTFVLERQISAVIDEVDAIEIRDEGAKGLEDAARDAYDLFKKKEAYISLTVNHDDLTNIEESFAELIGYLSVDDADGARVVKNRLFDSLEHLRRLSGFNIDAII